jgi:hypothetical protein
MSYPSALFGLLASLSDRDVAEVSVGSDVGSPAHDWRAPAHRRTMPRDEHAREEQWLAVGYPIVAAHAFFAQRAPSPPQIPGPGGEDRDLRIPRTLRPLDSGNTSLGFAARA